MVTRGLGGGQMFQCPDPTTAAVAADGMEEVATRDNNGAQSPDVAR